MCIKKAKIPAFIPWRKEVLPLCSPAFTYSLLPVPVDAETFTDREPEFVNSNCRNQNLMLKSDIKIA